MLMRSFDLSGGDADGGSSRAGGAGVGWGVAGAVACSGLTGGDDGVLVQAKSCSSSARRTNRVELVTESDTHDVDSGSS